MIQNDSSSLTNVKPTYTYQLTKGSEENERLQKWFSTAYPITVHGYSNRIFGNDNISDTAYYNRYEQLKNAASIFKQQIKTADPKFNAIMNTIVDVDLLYAPILYLAYRTDKLKYLFPQAFNGFNKVPDFYRQLIGEPIFCNQEMLQLKETSPLLNLYPKLKYALLNQEEKSKIAISGKLQWMLQTICNDTLKAVYLGRQMAEIEIDNLTDFRTIFQPLKHYFYLLPDLRKLYVENYEKYIADTAFIGKPIRDISLMDNYDKPVKLNSFKGKVVFFDTWATWCGPCKEQVPFLKEIQEEYKNNPDLIFVGLSIDKKEDKQKWKDMVKKEEFKGIQVIDELATKFARPYNIFAIPRFLLLGKDGKWIEVRCPKPENKAKLRQYLNKALATN
jgi:thiol-disulfide isomerase/thioredoxin